MISFVTLFGVLCTCVVLTAAVQPMTADELQHIRDFTAQAHMKRLQSYPDQIMTPSTHYLGRRVPAPEKPSFYMHVPGKIGNVKPTAYSIEPQTAGAVQNYVLNYSPVANNGIGHSGPIYQRPQTSYSYVPIQSANGPHRGPPPQFNKRPPFFSISDSPPSTSLFQLFFPKRPNRRPPPQSFRPPLRYEYSQASPSSLYQQQQQQQHNLLAQQNFLNVQQQQLQQQHQQRGVQPSASPSITQSTTIKNALGSQSTPTVVPSALPTVIASNAPNLVNANHQNQINLNQFHRDMSFFGKPFGKPPPPHKFIHQNNYVPHNRPADTQDYIQQFLAPKEYSFFQSGPPHMPPVIAGPTSNRFQAPVSFSHIEQMQFPLQPQSLPMHMVVQSQEFPNYHFSTTFTASSSENPKSSSPTSATPNTVSLPTQQTTITNHGFHVDNTVGNGNNNGNNIRNNNGNNIGNNNGNNIGNNNGNSNGNGEIASIQSPSIRQTHRVKKVRPRTTTTTTTTYAPPTHESQSLGEVIFESSKDTREFHDSARIVPQNNGHVFKSSITRAKPQPQPVHIQTHEEHEQGTQQKETVESSRVVLAPLVFAQESHEPLRITTTTTSPRPPSSTSISVSTVSTTTQAPPPFKAKITRSKGVEYHKSKLINESKVTASGAGFTAVTIEPFRTTSTGSATSSTSSSKSTSSPGRVVTTSVTSRVVSTGSNPQKRYRLRKVKLPNPEAKINKVSPSTTRLTTTNLPTTTPINSTRSPSRSTSTSISSTENSFTITS